MSNVIKKRVFCLVPSLTRVFSLSALALGLSLSAYAESDSIHSGIIIKDTVSAWPNCLHYHIPTHYCMWISQLGEVNTTPILDHYLPDLVVSVFAKPADNPWLEINAILDKGGQPIQKSIVQGITGFSAGSGSHTLLDVHEQSVIFKEADVIGNPALAFIPQHGLLPSTANPFQPYFQSMADSILWRGLPPAALPEEGMALGLNITHHVGTGLVNWGGIYPHEGKVINENEMKGSAVIAQRAADLITSQGYGHIYHPLSIACGTHCSAAPIQENSKETYFQMIYPVTQTSCSILGEGENAFSLSNETREMNTKGNYVWIIWRHYTGCADGEGTYIGRT